LPDTAAEAAENFLVWSLEMLAEDEDEDEEEEEEEEAEFEPRKYSTHSGVRRYEAALSSWSPRPS
jgi:hypothetical protein